MKKFVDQHTASSLRALIHMGKARVVKEYVDGNPELFIYSKSGKLIGVPHQKFRYMFETALIQQGSGDGLLDGHDQTTVLASEP